MSWTYDIATVRGRVRFAIGDTDTTDQQLQDAEIDYLLSDESDSIDRAAGRACEALAAKYSRQANKKVGDLAIEMEKIAQHYRDLAAQLYGRSQNHAVPTAGGVEVSDRNSNQSDASVTHSYLRRGMHDFTVPPVDPNAQ